MSERPLLIEIGCEEIPARMIPAATAELRSRILGILERAGLGHGCDTIAKKALRKAKFKPARANNGQAVDFEIPYEYEFRLTD